MNCHEFEKNVLTIASAGDSRSDYLKHAERCCKCANRLAEEQSLIAGFRAVIEHVASDSAPPRTEALLLETFRKHVIISSSSPQFLIAGFVSTRLAGAFATVILLISGLSLLAYQGRWISSSSEALIPAIRIERSEQLNAKIEDASVTSGTPGAKPKVKRQRPRTTPVVSSNELFTEYFPLTDEDASSMEITQVMRVELPASAMMDVGFPVADEELNKPITAEIGLGEDGIARAIRFVKLAGD
jgi:hypothetical protein